MAVQVLDIITTYMVLECIQLYSRTLYVAWK